MCLQNFKTFTRFCTSRNYSIGLTQRLRSSLVSKCDSRRPLVAGSCCNTINSVGFSRLNHGWTRTERTLTLSCRMSNTCIIDKSALFQVFNSCQYSTQKSSEAGNITEQFLKDKIIQDDDHDGAKKEPEKTESDGQKSGKSNENSWFHSKHAWKLGLVSLGVMCLMMCGNVIIMWGAPLLDKDGKEMEDEFSILPAWQAYPKRAYKEARFFKTMIQEPSYKKLLPDPLKEPWYQPPYTLVIELTGVLVHPDWTLGTGWRFKKRPAVTYFLQQVASPLFEVVIFTKEQGFTAFPIIDGLDPNGHVTYRLFRDATHYMDGSHVKDLDHLNRDLSKVILVDCDPKAVQKQPRNALLLKPWKGQDADRLLVDLATFLRTIAVSQVDDVRPVLEHYSQFDDPLEAFRENQRRIQGEQERTTTEQAPESKGLVGFGKSFLRRR